MWRLPGSVLRSILTAIRSDPEVARLAATHPKAMAWLGRRFARHNAYGLPMTIGAVVSLASLFLFASVVQDLVANEGLVLADLRVVTLLQIFRSPGLNNVMAYFTYLGNWQVILAGAGLLILYLGVMRQWLWMAALTLSIGGGEILVQLFKFGFGRSRPDLANALLPAHGASFPSGHAFVAVSFYGFVAWYALARTTSRTAKAFIALACLAVVCAIGFSRIYLGVHWPSDVLASFALASGWLALVVTGFTIAQDRTALAPRIPTGGTKVLAALLAISWMSFVVAFDYFDPLAEWAPLSTPSTELSAADFPAAMFRTAPRFSEDILGRPMEPINVVLVGSEADLDAAFAEAGWEPSDKISLDGSWRMLVAALRNRPPSHAPGLPTFWNSTPNPRAFEHIDANGTPRERHHLHLWDTSFRFNGDPVWVGTVHYDKEARTAGGHSLLIHEVDPAVDRERDALRENLGRTNCLKNLTDTTVTEPMLGQNAIGSPFFTDGKAIVVVLKCLEHQADSGVRP
jgi:undecaprenyl-diphosphatase